MPNSSDFDPAKAVEGVRQQWAAEESEKEARKQRAQTQKDLHRANVLKLLRYADEQLEQINNPIVSEFVVTERWSSEAGFLRKRTRSHESKTRYYGSWLSLINTYGTVNAASENTVSGLVKLREPRSGYALVNMEGIWDPRNACHFSGPVDSYNRLDRFSLTPTFERGSDRNPDKGFWVFTSLEEVLASLEEANRGGELRADLESLAKTVTQALDFVATGQPPQPKDVSYRYDF